MRTRPVDGLKMKKLKIAGAGRSEQLEVPRPKAKGDWALVKIMVAPMCTEYEDFSSGAECECLGHEAAGEVVEIDKKGSVNLGDRVVVMPQYPCGICDLCRAGDYIYCENTFDFPGYTGSDHGSETYAQYILKPSWLLAKIPDSMTYEHASMLCCGLGPTFGAMKEMGTGKKDDVLITGLGPVGLGGIINGIYMGARIIGVSRNSYRNKLAMKLGAETVLHPDDPGIREKILDLTGGKGVDMSIDCAGAESAQQLCINATKRRGQVAFVGESADLTVHVSDQLIRNGLTLHGIWHYNLKHIPEIFSVAKIFGKELDRLITHTFPLNKVEEAWELQSRRMCGKVLLYPWE